MSKKLGTLSTFYSAFDLFSEESNGVSHAAFTSIENDIVSSTATEKYLVCAYSRDSSLYTRFYVNGEYISTTVYATRTGYYSGSYLLNSSSRGGSMPGNNASGKVDLIMCAFGADHHTGEQIIKNSHWLMQKLSGDWSN